MLRVFKRSFGKQVSAIQNVLKKILNALTPSPSRLFHVRIQDISQERKKLCVLLELGNKMQLGVWTQCEHLNEFRGTTESST